MTPTCSCFRRASCRRSTEIDILKTWLDTPFEGGRHARRVEKIEPKDTNT